ncbi:hypothetical protein FACS1894153_0980 [Bacteroidia bacterium]|nr:hypothetical protein FACS1894153_0980 [Bacteroidia bacterium]
MDFNFIEIFGYIASFLLIVTFIVKDIKHIRWIGMFGCVFWVIYGFLRVSYPIMIANVIIVSVNIYYLFLVDYIKKIKVCKIDKVSKVDTKKTNEQQNSEQQQYFMQEAIRMAEENIDNAGGGPFGAVIVRNGEIIAKEANHVTTNNDPTAHAEVNAIRLACKNLETFDLSDCEIYASCEPCPMCLASIYWARIGKIYYAGNRMDAAKAGFDDDFIYSEMNKSMSDRKIPIIEILHSEGEKPLRRWLQTDGVTKY